MPMNGSINHPIVYFDENGCGPIEHVCALPRQPREVYVGREKAQAWLDRQRLLGLISEEGVRAVEKLIEEVK